jgi:hypothetical protein
MQILTTGCASITHEEWARQNEIFESMHKSADRQAIAARRFHCIGQEHMPECRDVR